MELYEHMTPYPDTESYYKDWLLPLWHNTYEHCKQRGWVCWNISPKMYHSAQMYGLPPAHAEEPLKQQLGQQTKAQDMIYMWQR